jgi:hypothetical protein
VWKLAYLQLVHPKLNFGGIYMERKQLVCLLLLTFTVTLFSYQAYVYGNAITSNYLPELKKEINHGELVADEISANDYNVQQINFTNPFGNATNPKVWFFVDIGIVALTPIVFIVQTVLNNQQKMEDKTEPDESEKEKLRITNELAQKKPFLMLIGIGFFMVFAQNVLILVLYIALLVTLPVGNPTLSKTMAQIFTIGYNVDFLGALLIIIGLALAAQSLQRPIQSYVAAGLWLLWIGVGLPPRILYIQSSGLFGPVNIENAQDLLVNFYGRDVFLITLGIIALSLALFYTSRVLVDDNLINGTGIANGFGITNYVVGSLFAIVLLSLLTYGLEMSASTAGSLFIFLSILSIAKFLVVPVIGLIAGIILGLQVFKRVNKIEAV